MCTGSLPGARGGIVYYTDPWRPPRHSSRARYRFRYLEGFLRDNPRFGSRSQPVRARSSNLSRRGTQETDRSSLKGTRRFPWPSRARREPTAGDPRHQPRAKPPRSSPRVPPRGGVPSVLTVRRQPSRLPAVFSALVVSRHSKALATALQRHPRLSGQAAGPGSANPGL